MDPTNSLSLSSYGDAVAVGLLWFAFSRSRAAFIVACCSRSESDFKRSASGVDCGFTLVSGLLEREQPAAARIITAESTSEKFFICGIVDRTDRIAMRKNRDCVSHIERNDRIHPVAMFQNQILQSIHCFCFGNVAEQKR